MKTSWRVRLREGALSFWKRQSARERLALRILAWAIALAIGVQMVWTLEQSRQEQLRRLPRLTHDAAQIAGLHADWQQLAIDKHATQAVVGEQAISPRLGELGPNIQREWKSDGRLQLSGVSNFATWVRWSGTLHQDYRLILEHAQIATAENQTHVTAIYRMARTTGEAP